MGCQREEREQMDRLGEFIVTKQMYRKIYSKKGDGRQYQLGKLLGHHSTYLGKDQWQGKTRWSAYPHTRTHTRTNTHTHMHTHAHTHMHTHTRTHTHTMYIMNEWKSGAHMHTHTHTCTHMHEQTLTAHVHK